MMRVIKHITQLAIGFFLISTAAQAQQGVCVYKDSQYEGPRRCFEDSVPNFARLGINDQISSFQIHGDVDVIFYEHRGFRGANKRFSGDQSQLYDGMNDNFSSMKIVDSYKQKQWGVTGAVGASIMTRITRTIMTGPVNQDEDDYGYDDDNKRL